MPPKKSPATLLKEAKDKYGGLSTEEATARIALDLADLHTSVEDLKARHAEAEKRKKGTLTFQRNGVEAKIATLQRYLASLSQSPTVDVTANVASVGAASSEVAPPAANVPVPPESAPARAAPAADVPVPLKTTPAPASLKSTAPAAKVPVPPKNPVPPNNALAGAAPAGEVPVPPKTAPDVPTPPKSVLAGATPPANVAAPPKTASMGAASSEVTPPAANVPVPPKSVLARAAPAANVPVPPKTTPMPASLKPATPAAPTASIPTPPKIASIGAASSKAALPAANVPLPPKNALAGAAPAGEVPVPPKTTPPPANVPVSPKIAPAPASPKSTAPAANVPIPPESAPEGAPADKVPAAESRKPRPRPRPVLPKAEMDEGSKSNPFMVEDIDIKPVVPPAHVVDANFDSGKEMQLLTTKQAEAMTTILRETAGEGSGPSSKKKRKNVRDEEGRKKRKVINEEGDGKDGQSVGRKRNRGEAGEGKRGRTSKRAKVEGDGVAMMNGKGKGREGPRNEAGPSNVMVKTGGEKEDGGAVNDNSELEEVEDKKVRKRAQKEQKTHWIFIVAPVKILPDGKVVSSRLRVLAPVDETETARYRLNQQGWREVHNLIVAGFNPSCAVLSRAKQLRWYCREIGGLSILLIWSIFINRNKRTRCHFHASTDRASAHNDIEPKISKTSRQPVHIVTGVGLPQDDELLASAGALENWRAFKTKAVNYELAGARDSAETILPTIGNLSAEDLLSFFRLENRRHYLGCGCDLMHATFDFFLWKVAPPLLSETVKESAECIGTPWDARLRPTLITLFSSMGLGPDNLDTVMKYNIHGQKNDLSSAPQFVRDFWTLNQALKASQWAKVGPPSPERSVQRPIPEFVDPDDFEEEEQVEFYSESDEDKPRGLGELDIPDSEEEEGGDAMPQLASAGSGVQIRADSVGTDGDQRGKEGQAPIDEFLRPPEASSNGGGGNEYDIVDVLRPDRRASTPLSPPPESPER